MANQETDVIDRIKAKGWWQGSVISTEKTRGLIDDAPGVDWWIITSQTCNLYNHNFEKVPVFEVIAAKTVDECTNQFKRGDKPRTLHVQADGPEVPVCLEVDIQKRVWLDRRLLADFDVPDLKIVDALPSDPNWRANQWLDTFAGWLARSYTRVTLPDQFNGILKRSRVEEVLDKKLADLGDELYGIYLLLASAEEEWNGVIGLMPPPYTLEILVVISETTDPEPIQKALVKRLFEDTISQKEFANEKGEFPALTRGQYSRNLGITIVPSGITTMATTEVSLQMIRSHIRYSNVDYLSDSTMSHAV